LGQACDARRLAWEDTLVETDVAAWDVVLFADVVCTDTAAELLAEVVDALLGQSGEVIGAVGLLRCGVAELFPAMRLRGFIAQELPISSQVLASAIAAAAALEKANSSDLGAVHGPPEKRCKLVRWMRRSSSGQNPYPDMSEKLRQQAVDAFWERESKLQIAAGWEIWE